MLGKRPHHPMIVRLSELLLSGTGGILEGATSPRSPLDYRIQSPRGLKSYDLGGVGLGIVAALDKPNSDSSGHEILLAKCSISSSNSNRSVPIPVFSCGKNCERWMKGGFEVENPESYTYVTCHRRPDNKSFTKVYYDGCECAQKKMCGFDSRRDDRLGGTVSWSKQFPTRNVEDVSSYPTLDFLSSCHLCRKKLHGKDIYMYRGEKGFCSVECRSRQIITDERKERCRSQDIPTSSAEASTSPYTRSSPIFSTGILAI